MSNKSDKLNKWVELQLDKGKSEDEIRSAISSMLYDDKVAGKDSFGVPSYDLLISTDLWDEESANKLSNDLSQVKENSEYTKASEKYSKVFGKLPKDKLKKLSDDIIKARPEYENAQFNYGKSEKENVDLLDRINKLKNEETELQNRWNQIEDNISLTLPSGESKLIQTLRTMVNYYPEGHPLHREGQLYKDIQLNREEQAKINKQHMYRNQEIGSRKVIRDVEGKANTPLDEKMLNMFPDLETTGYDAFNKQTPELREARASRDKALENLADLELKYMLNTGGYFKGSEGDQYSEISPNVKTYAEQEASKEFSDLIGW
tara:strand:- start:8219 stop:9175 length:957 start_codon:yes stop_codon:yes gene_type:complete